MGTHIPDIQTTALEFLKLNPDGNEDDSDEDFDEEESEDDDDSESEDDGYETDELEDDSFKVRRAAAKCLRSLIFSRSDLLMELYESVAAQLVSRFKEPKEIVKLEVFRCAIDCAGADQSSSDASALLLTF